jgi:transposase
MYVGVDYHKRYSVATLMDEKGVIVERFKFKNDPSSIRNFAEALPENCKMAFEATEGWYYFYEQMEDKCSEIRLAHPLKVRAIAEAKVKTDKIDATMLAHLLRTDLLPCSYIPPRKIRDNREIIRYRASLVSMRTALKNRIHSLLSKNGIISEYSDLFGKKSLNHLQSLDLRDNYRFALDGYIRMALLLKKLIVETTQKIQKIVSKDLKAELLTSIPGISYYSALLIVSEIGDVSRFSNAKKLCSYAGLVPSVRSSGGKTKYGSITKQGSKWLRWIMVELSKHFCMIPGKYSNMYARIAEKHGGNTARVAVSREMLKVIYYMLRDEKCFVSG